MSLSTVSYPVPSPGLNVFGGGAPVEIKFLRNDAPVVDTEAGDNNTVIVNLGGNITGSLNVGEYVYLNSGDVYDVAAEALEVENTYIRLDTQWIENTVDGYINYKQNYYVELDLINPDNENIKILPFTLRDDGDEAGNINIDLSIVNDLNAIEFPDYSAVNEMGESRVKFDIRKREIWRESQSTAYSRITDPIIIYPAKETGTIEAFTNGFSEPEYYVGYPNGAVYLHSDDDPAGDLLIIFYFSEQDINKQTIKSNSEIGQLDAQDVYGRLFIPLNNLTLLSNTEYITLYSESAAIPEFNPADFTSDFNIA
jgi:hypothetical protein